MKYRKIRTTAERRAWFAVLYDWREYGGPRPKWGRSARALPNSYDDISRAWRPHGIRKPLWRYHRRQRRLLKEGEE